jgi:hypothetical protein
MTEYHYVKQRLLPWTNSRNSELNLNDMRIGKKHEYSKELLSFQFRLCLLILILLLLLFSYSLMEPSPSWETANCAAT